MRVGDLQASQSHAFLDREGIVDAANVACASRDSVVVTQRCQARRVRFSRQPSLSADQNARVATQGDPVLVPRRQALNAWRKHWGVPRDLEAEALHVHSTTGDFLDEASTHIVAILLGFDSPTPGSMCRSYYQSIFHCKEREREAHGWSRVPRQGKQGACSRCLPTK